jgi:SulP family sulfate permease
MRRRFRISRATLRQDAVAGLVLGVQSVPDGLAAGLLAGASPLAGLYGYLVGTLAGAIFTSSAFMAVQTTGAMAMLVADMPEVHDAADPARAAFTLAVLTGVIMLVAGFLKLGSVLRFVSNAVMVGFLNAVGVNIVLGQLRDFTGYAAEGPNRIVRAIDTLVNPGQLHGPTVLVGVVTIALILLLERTRLGPLGLVVAVAASSGAALALGWSGVATLNDLGEVPNALPLPQMPLLGLVPILLVPALSLAFVGLVQGAGISAAYPNPDGTYPDVSRDFLGQGAANVAAGVFQGLPVGGSLSATALNKAAGARSRQSLVITGLVMAVVVVAFGRAIGYVAMPALAGLLMLIGFRTVKPANLRSVWRVGAIQRVVLVVTFVLTMLIPVQHAVLVGVGLSVILYVVRQSNQITIKRWELDAEGHVIETDPPGRLPANEVVVLQPYGSLFFAAAATFESSLPVPTEASRNSVVILRLRRRTELGVTFMDVLRRYAEALKRLDSKLVIVSVDERVLEQLAVTGITQVIGRENIYGRDERLGATVKRAHQDALTWVEQHRQTGG